MEDLKIKILELMEQKDFLPSDVDQIFSYLHLNSSQEFILLVKALNSLEDEYLIAHNAGKYASLEKFNLITGIIDIKEAGYGFVDCVDKSIFIRRDNLKGAITNDQVLVNYFTDKMGRYEGKVEKIIKRNTTSIVGKLQKHRKKYIVKSVNYRIDLWVYIKQENLKQAKLGDMVKVEITRHYNNNTADGKIIQIIGHEKQPHIDITSLVVSSGVSVSFTNETLEMARQIPQVIKLSDYPNRKDLTSRLIITIDGDDAKDLDDAISVEKLDNGNYLLGVYIADVSEYVKENNNLDQEAFERGTSIYLVDRVIPMLPQELSNGICSLNPNVERLVMSCEMEISPNGKVLSQQIYEAVIKSNYRMTYHNVNEILDDNEDICKQYQEILPMIKIMNELADILSDMREVRGSFNFETNEAKVLLDKNGKAIDIVVETRGKAERIIEEFMLIANETVATTMTWLDVPFIYRIHEEPSPEKISRFMQILDNFHYNFKVKNKKGMSKALQEVLIGLEQSQDEIAKAIINNALLRSMMKARYSQINVGHYGLASTCYTHFTSPIRRYPDLLVHRLIKHYLLNKNQLPDSLAVDYFMNKVYQTSVQSSKCEKKAETLERDTIDFKKCEYMINYLNHVFEGIISSITNWGIYITLPNTVEGLVRFDDMRDDYYDIDEINARIVGRKKGNIYQMGDKVSVKLLDVNLEKRQISFKLLGRKE